MTALVGVAALVLLGTVRWLAGLAVRVDRAHARVERSWAALDAALERRARAAVARACAPEVDPATTLLVCDAAAAALEAGQPLTDRELAESTLSRVLELTGLAGLEQEQGRVTLARRLHNDAGSTARALRGRFLVRRLRLAGHARPVGPFEMADPQELGWSRGRSGGR